MLAKKDSVRYPVANEQLSLPTEAGVMHDEGDDALHGMIDQTGGGTGFAERTGRRPNGCGSWTLWSFRDAASLTSGRALTPFGRIDYQIWRSVRRRANAKACGGVEQSRALGDFGVSGLVRNCGALEGFA
jgi:hypothetical protein